MSKMATIKGPKNKETGERTLLGFVYEGKYGPELALKTVIDGEFVKATAVVFTNEFGEEVRENLPPFSLSMFLDNRQAWEEAADNIRER